MEKLEAKLVELIEKGERVAPDAFAQLVAYYQMDAMIGVAAGLLFLAYGAYAIRRAAKTPLDYNDEPTGCAAVLYGSGAASAFVGLIVVTLNLATAIAPAGRVINRLLSL